MKKDRTQTPLAKARGDGSAHEGTHHWLNQRITAIANLPLMVWLVISVVQMPGWDYAEFTNWLAQPLNAILMILAIISTYYHAALGCQVIVEDYFHVKWMKIGKLIGIKLFFIATAVACIFSILKVAL